MVDLSDVIGKAVGGREGYLLDNLIDMLMKYYSSDRYKWTDTEIVSSILYDYAMTVGRGGSIAVVDDRDLYDAVNHVLGQITQLRIAGHDVEE